ncbi:LamG domain-containing protein [Paenibacillus albidus]|uniref:LamG domain-containing protein n=1 Tax=Paenibacillus albidus TaxID=2041023 RepID=UPI001BEB1317|nr:LamG domain-containing protein [Paenibacillus albidus]MBT2292302.1 LamG domain-containing protein [Paenibacillus albidus]
MTLNRSGAYAALPGGILDGVQEATFCTWVKVNSHSGWARLFDCGTGTDKYLFLAPKAEGSGLRFAITVAGNGAEQVINAPELATGVWTHDAVTLNGTTGILYVGVLEAGRNSAMSQTPASLGCSPLIYIAKSQWNAHYLSGQVDDFRIYNQGIKCF